MRILDVATGSADVPVAISHWAHRVGRRVDVVGLDLHATTLALAANFAGPGLPLVRGDALSLPFEDGAFDVVMTSMFLHHLPDELVTNALRRDVPRRRRRGDRGRPGPRPAGVRVGSG